MLKKTFNILLFSIILCIICFSQSCNIHTKTIANLHNTENEEILDTLQISENEKIISLVENDSVITTTNITDTLKNSENQAIDEDKKSTKIEVDEPVKYNCEGKAYFDFINKKAYLYEKANVDYGDINLTADYMEVNFSNKEVYAYGIADSAGAIPGKPKYKEGEEVFISDTIRYNFETKKGIVKNVTTEFEGSFLHGGTTKIHPNKHVHMINGQFTTCELDHPHFYFQITKAKVIPDDKIVSGPAYLVIEDIVTPIGLPFGFFPNKKGGCSGVIIPNVGNEEARGLFLRDGGYYWAINDYVDLTFLGDIYSKGSWAIGLKSNYKVRYRYNGRLSLNYNKNIFGYEGLPDYRKQDLFEFIWQYNQDSKARPNSTFSADVNMSSTKYDYNNAYNPANYMSTNKQSSISYSYNFPNLPFNFVATARHNQNNSSGSIDFNLPDIAFSMNRIYPLKRRVKVGQSAWYEKVGVSYSMNMTNKIRTNEKDFFNIKYDSISNGIVHRIPISTSFDVLKYTTLTPSFNYNERWYFKTMTKSWEIPPADTLNPAGILASGYNAGFARCWDYSASLDWRTQVYGMYVFKGDKNIKAIRHVVSPSLSLSYVPDFGKEKYGFYENYNQIVYNNHTGQYDTITRVYSRFEGLPYGGPPSGGSGLLNFNLGNNLEMKLKDKANTNDTVSKDKKLKLLESLAFSTSYNIFADSLKWSPLNINGRTKITFLDLSFRATLDPYSIEENAYGQFLRVNKFMWQSERKSKLARLTTAYTTIGFSLNSKKIEKKESSLNPYEILYGYPEHYVDFDIPWNLSINYAFNYSKPYETSSIVQTLNFSGDFNLTKKWKISFSSGYDIKRKEVTYTTIDVYRDLHCWEASLHLVPFGSHKSYMFQINVKASELQDLKLTKRRSWYDN